MSADPEPSNNRLGGSGTISAGRWPGSFSSFFLSRLQLSAPATRATARAATNGLRHLRTRARSMSHHRAVFCFALLTSSAVNQVCINPQTVLGWREIPDREVARAEPGRGAACVVICRVWRLGRKEQAHEGSEVSRIRRP